MSTTMMPRSIGGYGLLPRTTVCTWLALFGAVVGGCQSPHSTEWRPTAAEPPGEKATLAYAERQEILRVMRGVAPDHELSLDCRPEPVMWDDICRVVDAACSEVFMAVAQVSDVSEEAKRVYHLRTIDEKPATLTVRRSDESWMGYEATAEVGLFGTETDAARAADLVAHFEQHLGQFTQRRTAVGW